MSAVNRILVLGLTLICAGCGKSDNPDLARVDPAQLARGGAPENHYSPLDHIHDANVSTLGFRWQSEPLAGPVHTAPVVVDGVLYVQDSPGRASAFDAANGTKLGSFDIEQSEVREASNTGIPADLLLGPAQRSVVLEATTDGELHVRDRATNKLIASHPFVDEDVESVTVVALAHNVRKGLVYILVTAPPLADDTHPRWELHALNPVDGKKHWNLSLHRRGRYAGGLLSTSGNLIFIGSPDGYLDVYSAQWGSLLKRVAIGGHLTCPPITFVADGKQLVAIAHQLPDLGATHRVTCFGLGGPGAAPNVTESRGDLQQFPSTVERP